MAWIPGEAPITIFSGGDDGAFYARAVPGKSTYHYTYNWDCRAQGSASPALTPMRFTDTADSVLEVESAIAWEENSTLVPYVLGFGKRDLSTFYSIGKFKDGVIDADFKEGSSGEDRILRAVLYRNDGSDVDAEVIWTCNGSGNDFLFELLKDGTFRNTSHDYKADGLAVVGGDMWSWSGYKMRKLTTDSDPGLAASWQTAIPVGIPTYDINEVVDLGNSTVVLKPEGIFLFDPQISEFKNQTPSVSPHPDNGRGGFTDGRGRVYYPTVDGDMIVQTFGFQDQEKPTLETTIDRDTPFGRIGTMTADMEWVYAAVDPGYNLTQDGVGLFIQEFNNPTYTDQTSDLTDRSFTTTDATGAGAWALITSTNSDFIYIGTDVPFWGIDFTIETSATSLPEFSVSQVNYSTGTSTFANVLQIWDGTNDFTRSGLMVLFDDNAFDSGFSTPWVKGTVNSVEKYWIRLEPLLPTGLTVSEVKVAPFRPPLDNDIHPITGQATAGVLPKIIAGKWVGEDIVWHDLWTLEGSVITAMAVSRVGYTGGSGKRNLVAFSDAEQGSGRLSVFAMPIGADNDPIRQPFAKLADYSESGVGFDEHAIWFSGHDSFIHARALKKVGAGTIVDFPNVQSDDDVYLYAWWDTDAARVQKIQAKGSHMVLPEIEGEGRILYMALQFVDGSRDEIAPQLLSVEIPAGVWEWEDDPTATPPLKEDQAAPIQR